MAIGIDARKPDLIGKSVRSLTVRRKAKAYCRNAAEFTLPRKTSKENAWEPYLKPTQVDEENIHRRSSESSFRN